MSADILPISILFEFSTYSSRQPPVFDVLVEYHRRSIRRQKVGKCVTCPDAHPDRHWCGVYALRLFSASAK